MLCLMRLVVIENTTRTGLSNNTFDNNLASQKQTLYSYQQALHNLTLQFFLEDELCTGVYGPGKKWA